MFIFIRLFLHNTLQILVFGRRNKRIYSHKGSKMYKTKMNLFIRLNHRHRNQLKRVQLESHFAP